MRPLKQQLIHKAYHFQQKKVLGSTLRTILLVTEW